MKNLKSVLLVLMVLLSVQMIGAHDEVEKREFTNIDGINIYHDLLANHEAIRFAEAKDIEVVSVRPLVWGTGFDWYRLKVQFVSPDSGGSEVSRECSFAVESIEGSYAESFSMLGRCKRVFWPGNNPYD